MAHDRGKGEETYSIAFDPLAINELAALDVLWRGEIRSAIIAKLCTRPNIYGKPLRRTLKGCWTLRVGDYRIVYRIERKTVKILAVIHRSSDYKGIDKRI